jgi:glycosyltransferase
MKISIITISFNSAKTIEATLNSVLNQTYKNIQHIIIDGNSSDQSVQICKKFAHVSKIISEEDSGVYNAFNKGLEIANGDVVGFLNSDDTFYNNNSLQTIVDGFKKGIDAVHGNLKFYNHKNKVVRNWISKPFEKGAFKKGWMPAHPTFYSRKNIYNKYGNYNELFKIAGDFELMLRFIETKNVKTMFIDKNLVKMKAGGISNSGFISKIKILKEEFFAFDLNKISLNKFSYLINKAVKIKEFL